MISFDLKCRHAHVFEVWFRSSEAYAAQRDSGLIACPVCGDSGIEKAVMAPAVAAKSNQRPEPTSQKPTMPDATLAMSNAPADLERAKALLVAMARAQAKALETSQWVGDRFGEMVRAMHYGEAEHAPIHGTAATDEARAMIEEGLPVAPLIVPIAPPDQTH
jgi:hypothetical protein